MEPKVLPINSYPLWHCVRFTTTAVGSRLARVRHQRLDSEKTKTEPAHNSQFLDSSVVDPQTGRSETFAWQHGQENRQPLVRFLRTEPPLDPRRINRLASPSGVPHGGAQTVHRLSRELTNPNSKTSRISSNTVEHCIRHRP